MGLFILTLEDAAYILGTSVSTVRRLSYRGEIKLAAFRGDMYHKVFVDRVSLDNYLRRIGNGNEAPDERTSTECEECRQSAIEAYSDGEECLYETD
jgi:hypothetical protein